MYKPQYIDLGLPSGLLWSSDRVSLNDADATDNFTYDEALLHFGDSLPHPEDYEELCLYCEIDWKKKLNGLEIVGPNGNSIFMPAGGFAFRCNESDLHSNSFVGYYWTCLDCSHGDAHDQTSAFCLAFDDFSQFVFDWSELKSSFFPVFLIKHPYINEVVDSSEQEGV